MYIKVTNLTKTFHKNIREYLIGYGASVLGLTTNTELDRKVVHAVDNLSFEVHEGERVGIIGKNGAGKTTFLTLLAGISRPTSGSIDIQGRVNCILALGTNLREDLTGRENIVIDAEINGYTNDEINRLLEESIPFAELGAYIDQPVRTYSSGMKARLSFAMITFIQPEILIIDEALSAGDLQFSQKASVKMKEITSRGKILLVVSHSMPSIIDLCNRCIWLEKGRIVMDGDPKTVTEAYLDATRQENEQKFLDRINAKIQKASYLPGLDLNSPEFIDNQGKKKVIFDKGEPLTIRISITSSTVLDDIDIAIAIIRSDGIEMISGIFSESPSNRENKENLSILGTTVFTIPMGPVLLGKGIYNVEVKVIKRFNNYTIISQDTIIAESQSILSVENKDFPYENPVYWWPAEWKYEQLEE